MLKICNKEVSAVNRLIRTISEEAGYPIIKASNDKIIRLDKMPCISIQEQRMMLKSGIIIPIPKIKTATVSIYLKAIMAPIKQSD